MKMNRQCEVCGRHFTAMKERNKACSKACGYKLASSSLRNNKRGRDARDPSAQVQRFFNHTITEVNGCVLWTGGKTKRGYGSFRLLDTQQVAHRWIYEMTVGDIPPGFQLDHLCRNTACVNVHHLEPVTPWENMHRANPWHFQKNKTHCIHGHPFDAANTIWVIGPKGGRVRNCRRCREIRSHQAYERKLARKFMN